MDLQPNVKTIKLLGGKKKEKIFTTSQPQAGNSFLHGISKAQNKPKIIKWTSEKYS